MSFEHTFAHIISIAPKFMSPITFAQRVEHILTYNKIIDGKLFPDAFSSCIKPSYSSYKDKAQLRNYCFELSQENFNDIINDNCYICGKNKCYGIDRYNNNIGYIESNVKSCCGQCNIMKKTMEYGKFLDKLQLIHRNISAKQIDYSGSIITHMLNRNAAKLTPEQIKENARVKKQRQREAQKEKVENIVAKKVAERKVVSAEEKREKERIKKQKQREAIKSTGIKKEITDEMREKERLKKQKQREAKKSKDEQKSE